MPDRTVGHLSPPREPTMTCATCGRVVIVKRDGRGFPPDIARRKLTKLCAEAGHFASPKYLAGIG